MNDDSMQMVLSDSSSPERVDGFPLDFTTGITISLLAIVAIHMMNSIYHYIRTKIASLKKNRKDD